MHKSFLKHILPEKNNQCSISLKRNRLYNVSLQKPPSISHENILDLAARIHLLESHALHNSRYNENQSLIELSQGLTGVQTGNERLNHALKHLYIEEDEHWEEKYC
jgi:hypothetical protein